jgi:PBP1b-binding outer membrane lipoprotein LpoB
MNMSRTLLVSFVLSAFVLTGCFEEPPREYNQEPQVAFSQYQGEYVVSLPEGDTLDSDTFSTDNFGATPLQVQLIGPQRSQSLTVSASRDTLIAPGSFNESSLSFSQEVQIPANSSFGQLVLQQQSGEMGLDSTETAEVRFQLTGTNDQGVDVAPNFSEFTIFIQGSGP